MVYQFGRKQIKRHTEVLLIKKIRGILVIMSPKLSQIIFDKIELTLKENKR